MNPFAILGLPNTATVQQAKASYRKLAQKHHPDKGGTEAKFKEIQAAWEAIDKGWRYVEPPKKPQPPTSENVYNATEAVYSQRTTTAINVIKAEKVGEHHSAELGSYFVHTSIGRAVEGITAELEAAGRVFHVFLPKGIPHLFDGVFRTPVGKFHLKVYFRQSAFNYTSMNQARTQKIVDRQTGREHTICFTSPLSTTIEVNIARGRHNTWNPRKQAYAQKIMDASGKMVDVDIPEKQGFGPWTVTIPNLGYFDWDATAHCALPKRGDLTIRVIAIDRVEMGYY